jgi:magnesium chelatase subunit D
VPIGVMEDRLLGSIDLEESIRKGRASFQPGLLAEAHRGVLYIDDINLMDTSILSIIFNCLSQGYVQVGMMLRKGCSEPSMPTMVTPFCQVEREGVSLRYPFKPILVGTFCPDGGDISDFFLDKVGVSLSADAKPLSIEERKVRPVMAG